MKKHTVTKKKPTVHKKVVRKKTTVRFVPPVVVEEVVQEQVMPNKLLDEIHGDNVVDGPVEDVPIAPADDTFTYVEQMPEFNGNLQNYLVKNIKYPESAKDRGIQGKVYVRFTVTTTGAIRNVRVMRGVDPDLDREALRVIRNMPSWKPGKQNGKPVNVYFTQPISFRLQ